MNALPAFLLLVPSLAFATDGTVPRKEISIAGITIGESSAQVTTKLGEPSRKVETGDFLDYDYPQVRVSMGEDVVAGLYSDDPHGCTPMQLCPGDSVAKMRSTYGPPVVSKRETGTFYKFYATDFMPGQSMRFEDGSTLTWTSKESVKYTESGYVADVWVDMDAGFFSRKKIVKLESLRSWTQAPHGIESLEIPESKRMDIVEKIRRYYAGRPIEFE